MKRFRLMHATVFALVAMTAVRLLLQQVHDARKRRIKAQWAQVQNQLQRRNDLIPNLVETVKGYAAHEAGVFKDIADARSKLLAAKTPGRNHPGRQPADLGARPPARGRRELSEPQGRTSSSTG